jgi:hypothetical protein
VFSTEEDDDIDLYEDIDEEEDECIEIEDEK